MKEGYQEWREDIRSGGTTKIVKGGHQEWREDNNNEGRASGVEGRKQ